MSSVRDKSSRGWGKDEVACTAGFTLITRIGQNHIYTVYIQCFWQGNHQIYGHIRCIRTVLANTTYHLTPSLSQGCACIHAGAAATLPECVCTFSRVCLYSSGSDSYAAWMRLHQKAVYLMRTKKPWTPWLAPWLISWANTTAHCECMHACAYVFECM